MRALACLLSFVVSASCFAQAAQPDYAREKRWADEITPAILVGDPLYLALRSGHKFLALHAPNPKARAGVIVVHGMGTHPDWNLINVLRSQLAEQGYTTLSVQMPVLAADAKADSYTALFPEAAERLQAAVVYLQEKGHRRIAVVSHSLGSRMVNHFLAAVHDRGGADAVNAWVSVGINSGVYLQAETFKAPVLDIYGDKGFPVVMENAARRAEAIRRVRGFGQISVAGAEHCFTGAEAELVRHVKRFLDNATR